MADMTKLAKAAYDRSREEYEEYERDGLLLAYADRKRELDILMGEMEVLKELILDGLMSDGLESYKLDGVGSVRVDPGRETKTIDPKKLYEAGVDSAVIEECTVVRQGSPFPVILVTRKENKEL